MFGFGKNKAKKAWESFIKIGAVVCGNYMLMKSIGRHAIDESEISEEELPFFEACYLYGLHDGLAHGIDADQQYINQAIIIDQAVGNCQTYKLLGENVDEAELIDYVIQNKHHPAILNIIVAGGVSAQEYTLATINDEDVTKLNQIMSPKHFSNSHLVNDFKNFFIS